MDSTHIEQIKKYYIKESGSYDSEYIHKNLIKDLCVNVEFTILMLVLKHLNNTYSYDMKIVNPKNVHKFQNEYNLNLMFISDLQMNCFGSVSEQIMDFENMMPYYLKEKISEQKMKAIDRILSDEESLRHITLQNFLAWGSLLLTLLFGLPAIIDTITIIRKSLMFIPNDLPCLSIQNVGIFIWVCLLVLACIHTVKCTCNNIKSKLKF